MIARPCPQCGASSDTETLMDPGSQHRRSPGDVSVCFHCADVLEYGRDLALFTCIDPQKIGDRRVVKLRRHLRADIRRRRDARN